MKLLFTIFITLGISIWLGLSIVEDPGLIYFAYKNHTVEMPLWFGVLALFVAFCLLYYFIRFCSSIFHIPYRVRRWHQHQKLLQTYQAMARGMLDLNQGEWRKAQRQFISTTPEDKAIAAVNFLGAAKAAQASGDLQNRDEYLRKAELANPKALLSIELTRAEFQIESGELAAALNTLTTLKQQHHHHPHILRLLKDLYLKTSDWKCLSELLPQLSRNRIIPQAEYDALQVTAYRGIVEEASETMSLERLKKLWQQFPSNVKSHPMVLAKYAAGLIRYKAFDEAESLLYYALKKKSDDELVRYYGLCQSSYAAKHLSRAESMLKKDPNNPALLLSLGRIAMQNRLWGKARTYFENSLQLAPNPEVYHEMAALLDKIDEPRLALDYYRQGLHASLSHEELSIIDKKD